MKNLRGQTSLEAARGAHRFHSRGQTSLEALISFAALLFALSILCISAAKMSVSLSKSVELSSERISLSQDALFIDSIAASPFFASGRNFSAVPNADGFAIASKKEPTVRETVFSRVSLGMDGKLYIEKKEGEPV